MDVHQGWIQTNRTGYLCRASIYAPPLIIYAGNLIICLLRCFNFQRFFLPTPPARGAYFAHPSIRGALQFNVFTRGEVRLVGGRSPSGVGNERLATLRRTREIVRVTHVVELERVSRAVRETEIGERRAIAKRGKGLREGTIGANECLLVKQTGFCVP